MCRSTIRPMCTDLGGIPPIPPITGTIRSDISAVPSSASVPAYTSDSMPSHGPGLIGHFTALTSISPGREISTGTSAEEVTPGLPGDIILHTATGLPTEILEQVNALDRGLHGYHRQVRNGAAIRARELNGRTAERLRLHPRRVRRLQQGRELRWYGILPSEASVMEASNAERENAAG